MDGYLATLHLGILTEMIDAATRHGSELHVEVARAVRCGPRNLSPSEVPSTLVVANYQIRLQVRPHAFAGVLVDPTSLESDLTTCFPRSKDMSYVLHSGHRALAVFSQHGRFYAMDPRSAKLWECEDVATLAAMTFQALASGTGYTLNDVVVLHFRRYDVSK